MWAPHACAVMPWGGGDCTLSLAWEDATMMPLQHFRTDRGGRGSLTQVFSWYELRVGSAGVICPSHHQTYDGIALRDDEGKCRLCYSGAKSENRCRVRFCISLRRPGIDSKESIPSTYATWRAVTSNWVVVPAQQAGNRFLNSLNGLQIRTLEFEILLTRASLLLRSCLNIFDDFLFFQKWKEHCTSLLNRNIRFAKPRIKATYSTVLLVPGTVLGCFLININFTIHKTSLVAYQH